MKKYEVMASPRGWGISFRAKRKDWDEDGWWFRPTSARDQRLMWLGLLLLAVLVALWEMMT